MTEDFRRGMAAGAALITSGLCFAVAATGDTPRPLMAVVIGVLLVGYVVAGWPR